MIENVKTSNGNGVLSADGLGKDSPEFLREMLATIRTQKPQPITDLPDGVTDLRFYRVWMSGKNGLRVQAK